MRKTLYPYTCLIIFFLAACQPVPPQPVFTPSNDSTITPIPRSSAAPAAAATLPGVIWSFDIAPNLSTIVFATSKGALVYDFQTLQYLRTLNPGENVYRLAWSRDGNRLAVSTLKVFKDYGQAELKIWDASNWQVVLQPDFEDSMVNERILDIAWAPDGHALAIGTDLHGAIALDAKTGRIISHQKEFAASVTGVSWSPDGSRLIANNDMAYGIRRWKVKNDLAVRLFDPRAGNAMQVAWAPNGKRIASGHSNGAVCLWTAATNQCDGFIQAHRSGVFSLSWSPDGEKLATGGGVIRIWDAQTGVLLGTFGEEPVFIYTHLEWPSLDHPLVALQTGLEDQAVTLVRFWDPVSGLPLVEFRGGER